MNRNLSLAATVALLLGGTPAGQSDYRYRPREFTLDEEEEQSVRRMLNRARALRRQTKRDRRLAAERQAAKIAAEKEAARPKSRQELRAKERSLFKGGFRPERARGKSSSLKRMLGKKRRLV